MYVHWYWHDLAWDCYTSFFPNLYQSYSPLFTQKFRFRSISWEQQVIISPNFIYALIWTISSLGLLHVIFFWNVYQSFGPLFTLKFRFRSISLELLFRIAPNFIYALILTRSSFGLLRVIFGNLYRSFGPLFFIFSFPLNIEACIGGGGYQISHAPWSKQAIIPYKLANIPIINFPKFSTSLEVIEILNQVSHIPGSKMDSILYPWK